MSLRSTNPDPSLDFPVTDAAATSFFAQLHAMVYLRPFLARDCTLADAAAQAQVTRQRMNYWVNKMLRAQLIQKVGDEKRGGRLVPVYRTTHDSFVLHLSHLPHATIDALMDFLAGQWWWERFKSAYTRAWDAGLLKGRIRIFREGDSAIVDSLPETPQVDEAIHNHWRRMTLTKAQVARLREDMEQMLDEYSELINSESEETVVVHVAAVRESLRR